MDLLMCARQSTLKFISACVCHVLYLRCVSEPPHRGALSDGARHNFDRKGVVVVSGQSVSTERALELAIEAGAEDVRETEDEEEQRLLQVSCEEAS